ncbi:MAG: alanine--glyoxylate aminotransferase family protein, partial [Cyanobacteria bacterium]|nr:alanine--glyoxylate aminotransferase family protein [Cyanobacteriota bacterium]
VFPRLKEVFQTENDVFLYTASGTGAMEASLINTLNPGDRVLALVCGVFSERWAEVAESLGCVVDRLVVEPGHANTPEMLSNHMAQDTNHQIKAVMLTHSETSTGVLNPLKELASLINRHGALSIVDAVTSMGAISVPVDEWQLDLVISGSQKGFMIPPGLSFLSVSPKAFEAFRNCKNPGYYFNFAKYKKAQDDFTTPYTPATHLILGLDVALEMMMTESLPHVFRRHLHLTQMVRAGVKAMGLSLLVQDDCYASPAATAVKPPEGITVPQIRQGLKERYGIIVADGQKQLKGKIFRIGHLGHVGEREVLMVLSSLESLLASLGCPVPSGAAVAAAQAAKKELFSHVS